MEQPAQQLLLDFFRVMANADRVRIASMLMDTPRTIAQISAALSLKPSDTLAHVAALRELELVTAQPHIDQTVYRFDSKALYALNRTLLSRENQRTPVDDLPDEQTRKTLRHYFEGSRLTQLPSHPGKFQMLIEWMVTCFEEGVRYPERQVNEIIERYHEDYATLRRAMIDAGLMQREAGIYWRISA